MAKTVWKYPIELTSFQLIEMPEGAELLTVQIQASKLCIWAIVDPGKPAKAMQVFIVGTNNPLPQEAWNYLGTVQHGQFVWHVFWS